MHQVTTGAEERTSSQELEALTAAAPSRWRRLAGWCNAYRPRVLALVEVNRAQGYAERIGREWLARINDPKLRHQAAIGVLLGKPTLLLSGADIHPDYCHVTLGDLASIEMAPAGSQRLLVAQLADGSTPRVLTFSARYQRELAGFVDEAKSLAIDPVALVEGLAAERHAAMDRAAVLRHDRKRARDDAQQHYRELRDRHAAAQQVRELPPGQR